MISPALLIHHFLESNALLRPDKVAVVQDQRRATYGQINGWANATAKRLIDGGLSPGDRVILLLDNSLEYVVGYYGALKAGGVAVPLCAEITKEGLHRMLQSLEPRGVIAAGKQERLLAGLESFIPDPPLVIAGNRVPHHSGCFIAWEDVFAESDAGNPETPLGEEALGSIIFTSGSTGEPKGVMLSHRNIVANTRSIVQYLELDERDVQMVVLPFYYVMGKSLLNTHFSVGGTVVLNNRFAFSAQLIEQMISEQVTGFAGVPSTYSYLLHRSSLAGCRDRLSSLRYCTQAGGHLPKQTKEELLRVLPERVKLYVMYGATEAAARLAYVEPERLTAKLDAIGKPIPGVTLSVRDAAGRELGVGEVGEIVAAGPNIMKGYWKDPDTTARVLSTHGYHTGDLGYRDEEGYFYVVGRKDNLLKIGGHRINPKEVEDVLMETGLLLEVAVLGVTDEMLEKRLVAVAAPKMPGCCENDIMRCCLGKLPKHKMPTAVKLVGALPKNHHGKVDTRRCMELAQDCLLQAGNY
ncbi:class I adenylate-forming enzyme family protein [Geobacter sp. DSM 9736]|uniref:class I adenylate-forming enzyme family protein n=1 Tax=Geobacter sp. DSM 9736 TaxID=1277350 RepID=UPI000B50B2D6|nr:class I adenylate-forming enzyme family protein [Geobacter sp. DSM 9736]SNB46563.1 Acyl-CoA synthetase (AMP-forming)/AMP-acid ligase II [Geobacter sp. DSM 9736]